MGDLPEWSIGLWVFAHHLYLRCKKLFCDLDAGVIRVSAGCCMTSDSWRSTRSASSSSPAEFSTSFTLNPRSRSDCRICAPATEYSTTAKILLRRLSANRESRWHKSRNGDVLDFQTKPCISTCRDSCNRVCDNVSDKRVCVALVEFSPWQYTEKVGAHKSVCRKVGVMEFWLNHTWKRPAFPRLPSTGLIFYN